MLQMSFLTLCQVKTKHVSCQLTSDVFVSSWKDELKDEGSLISAGKYVFINCFHFSEKLSFVD